jgi:hypothetical protein
VILALLILLGLADIATTIIALRQPGTYEANPVAARLMKLIGPIPAMVALKAICTAVIVIVALHWPLVGWLFIAGYGYVLWNNISVIRS